MILKRYLSHKQQHKQKKSIEQDLLPQEITLTLHRALFGHNYFVHHLRSLNDSNK